MVAPDLLEAVQGYARRLHAHALREGPVHHVASPLGAWLLLAVLADLPGAVDADGFADALGADPDAAREHALRLLASPPDAVHVAAATWNVPLVDGGPIERWVAALPAQVPTGPIPTQAALDAWAREHTDGMIERFPLELDPDTFLLLASALATRVSWTTAFDRVPADDLGGASPWTHLRHALRTPVGGVHRGHVAHRRGNLLGVHVAPADGLAVVSVVGPRDAPPDEVLSAALDLAPDAATRQLAGVSLWDLPGDGHAWTLRDDPVRVHRRHERPERVEAVLPAWQVSTRTDLGTDDRLGVSALTPVLSDAIPPNLRPVELEAVQVARAGFDTEGFEAAAVTAFAWMARGAAAAPEVKARERVATIRFDRPFAAVAVATDQRWWGLPVFSAWVAEAVEPSDPS